jgi:hypothetical protein
MKKKLILSYSRNWTVIAQFFAIMFLMHLLLITSPINSNHKVCASPLTHIDNVWEGGAGFPRNDDPAFAWDLGNKSIRNNPDTPLNVSVSHPDYYKFTVHPNYYFSVSIVFNQTNVYNATDSNGSLIVIPETPFYADLDLQVLAANGTILGESNGNSNIEAIDPIYTSMSTPSEEYIINVTAVVPEIGYENMNYSTTYNMSIVFEDEFEALQSNDNFEDIDDPSDGSSFDEIVPGEYRNLRFSTNKWTESGNVDWYVIWFYENTDVNMTISAYVDPAQSTQQGPDLYVYNETINITDKYSFTVDYFKDLGDASPNTTEILTFTTDYSGWYYIEVDNNNWNSSDYYTFIIDTEDSYEYEGSIPNNDNTTAKKLEFVGEYPGLVISEGKDDWYFIEVLEQERIMVDLHWFPFIGDLNLSLFQNSSASSLVSNGEPIFNGLRAGPDRANKSTWYYIHVSGDNTDPRYYNLTIEIEDIDDWAEDNDFPTPILNNKPYHLTTRNHVFEPTELDPWAGLFSLKGDPDWFAISLIAGDYITVRIEFNGLEGDLDLKLYDGALNEKVVSELSPSNEETVAHRVRYSDIYLFVIYGQPSTFATIGVEYNMTITLLEYDDYFESNDEAITAAPIAEGNYTDLLLRDADDDWYYVYLHESDVIEITLTYFADSFEIGEDVYLNDIDVDLLDESESFATEDPNAGRTLFNESFVHTVTSSGKYYIVCVIDGSSNSYNLTIKIEETDDMYEDNDVLSDAYKLDVETSFNTTTSRIENLRIRVRDDDYYSVSIPAGLAIIVEISFSTTHNLDLELLSPNGTILDSSYQLTGNFEKVDPFPMNSTYISLYNESKIYFRVFMETGLIAQYTLNVTIGPEAVLITRETIPPFTSLTTKPKPFDWGPVIIVGGGGVILGGGVAAGLYGAKQTGLLSKASESIKGRLGKGDTGGTGGKGGKKIGKKKPPG